MQLLELTLPTPAENVALDDALLEQAERGEATTDVLRLWESPSRLVVVGRSSRIEQEVNLAACQSAGVPILRRASGGAAIVAGPGCLMYAVVLSYEGRQGLRALDEAHRYVLERLAAALRPLVPGVARRGTSDLAIGEFKFSGNSMRCRRHHFLYHGTLLYDFPLELVGRYLNMPPRQPDYRAGRHHSDFVANLPIDRAALLRAVTTAWPIEDRLNDVPMPLVAELVASKYGTEPWNR